ncbi:MAG: hypothetical protein KDA37_00585 [Planctomycetales bacterium]|nr:hypothetical protein [Planctomycetales bacterium]
MASRTNHLNQSHLTRCLLALSAWLLAPLCLAQYSNFTDYSKAYQKNLASRPGMTMDTNRYLYDRYFRNSPGVSPYLSGAVLGGSDSGTAYTAVVRPDLQRREAARVAQARAVQQRKLQGNVGYTSHPGAGYMGALPGSGISKPVKPQVGNVGAYQNHWYGAWQR